MIVLSHAWLRAGTVGLMLALSAACGAGAPASEDEHASADEYERGPHRGRMLRDGDFAVEITIFEDGVTPEFHVYAYRNNQPIDPGEVQLSITLTRLGGQVDQFSFAAEADYLKGGAVVTEPHSFDVAVRAQYEGAAHH